MDKECQPIEVKVKILRGRMQLEDIAKSLNISRMTLHRRIQYGGWKQKEVDKIDKLLQPAKKPVKSNNFVTMQFCEQKNRISLIEMSGLTQQSLDAFVEFLKEYKKLKLWH